MSNQEATEGQQLIHRQMTIQEILSLFPSKAQRLAQEITNAGLHCVGCHAATWETLEAGMRGHGFPEEAIDRLLGKLNAILLKDSNVDKSTITMTPHAAEKFLEFAQAEGKQGCGLRFRDVLKGCSGFAYELDFSDAALPGDEVFKSNGIEIHVPKECVGRLLGSVIDFTHTLHSSGFTVENPNTASSCGCGSSHNYGKEAQKSEQGGCCGSKKRSSYDNAYEYNYIPEESHGHGHGHGGGCCGGH